MKKSLVFLLIFVLIVPSVIKPGNKVHGESINNIDSTIDVDFIDSDFEVTPYRLPGDFSNNCKIIKTYKNDNVKFNKVSEVIARSTLGALGAIIPFKTLVRRIIAGIIGANINIPKNKNVWTTTQVRECKDSKGYHRTLIIKYYEDSKRTKSLGVQFVKLN